ncbi:hypothetical protein Q9S78_03130 [Microbacterium sp. KSW-18]|uniref:Uncharacterized protein n=1 Tax=Microbacterium aquilitoris TaxID=3067307 RepID=A0ABU3GG32_9MICO|nr:hypothetical protein [Microbacterium sp. KSW-18]MDT3329657.1 hypothetical protein [Microbacterium sp. KSW-18]
MTPSDSWRQRWAERRSRPGDGRPLQPYRWWQALSRSMFAITLPSPEGTASTFTVDVHHWGDRDDGEVRARLYRDGAQSAVSRLPARFRVPGGHIEVATTSYGLRRCQFVSEGGDERQLSPHPGSGEGRRARLHRRHPILSHAIGVVTFATVLLGVCVAVPQLIETISHTELIADSFGTFTSPIRLSVGGNITLGVAVVVASTERALRLRSNWLDELAE